MLAQREAVVDQIGLGHGGPRRRGEWRPHIEYHNFDRGLLRCVQTLLEERRRGFFSAMLDHFQDGAVLAIVQDADVMMSSLEALLIHHQVGDWTPLVASAQTTLHRPLHQVADLIRRQAEQLGGAALNLRREEHIQREAFKEQREAPVGGRPRNVRRLHAAGAAVHPLDSRREHGLELTGIQMPPNASLLMIINGRWGVTTGTAKETWASGMRQHDSNFGLEVVDLDRFDKSRSGSMRGGPIAEKRPI